MAATPAGGNLAGIDTATTLTALKALALRVQFLDKQDTDLTRQIDALAAEMNRALRAATAWVRTPPLNCSSPPAPVHTGSGPAARQHSPPSSNATTPLPPLTESGSQPLLDTNRSMIDDDW